MEADEKAQSDPYVESIPTVMSWRRNCWNSWKRNLMRCPVCWPESISKGCFYPFMGLGLWGKRLRTYRQPALNTCKEHLWPKTYHKPEEAYYKLCNSIVTVSDESMTCLHFRQYLPLIHGVRNLLLQQVEAILRRNDMNNGRQLEPPGKTHQLGSPPCVKACKSCSSTSVIRKGTTAYSISS